jgi:hypothetical protein
MDFIPRTGSIARFFIFAKIRFHKRAAAELCFPAGLREVNEKCFLDSRAIAGKMERVQR